MMQTNSLTVLVVDDELPLREELRLFPWSACNAELAGEAENGEEALELCRKLAPDVVITDITMPVMDGMELFRNIKREFPLTQVILLTCHSDFEYARDAVKLGALEYLVKVSLHDSDLKQALDKARQAIDRDRNYRRSETDKQRWSLSGLLSQMVIGTESKEEEYAESGVLEAVNSIWKKWKLSFPLRFVRIHVNARPENEMYVHHELQLMFGEREQVTPAFYRWVPLGSTDYLFLFEHETDEAGLPQQVKADLDALQAQLEQRLSYVNEAVRLFAVIGLPVENSRALLAEISRAPLPPGADFYDSSGTVYVTGAEGYPAAAGQLSEQAKVAQLGQIRKAAAAGREELVRYLRRGLTEWASGMRADPDELKQWLRQVAAELPDNKDAEGGLTGKRQLQAISRARTLDGLITAFSRELEEADGVKNKCRKEVAAAKQLIADRLSEPVTLTLIAEEVGLSSFYLSRLFREEVGESFNEYVTRLRIDKAIHLLQTTNMKVYEVAEQVGIPSYRYFSVLFRNRTGVAPTEFKKG